MFIACRKKLFFCAALTAGSLTAQWIDHPTPGIPRTPDGKPNLSAPAPRTADGKPDLSGLWGFNPGAYAMNITADLKPGEVKPWADSLAKERLENLSKEDPYLKCLPQGPRSNLYQPLMNKIVQTPGLILILSEDLTYRQVFMDGRELEKSPNPSFTGYSVGRWEGDTLVVESNGYNDKTWLDFSGHPHTEALRITERFHRTDWGHMEIEEILRDPEIYARPPTIRIHANLVPDTEMIEFICAENEKDRQHLVGKASDDQKYAVKVAPEILSKYVGTYEFRYPETPATPVLYNLTISGEDLFFDTEGKDKIRLIPLSETLFSLLGDRMGIRRDDKGAATHLIFIAAEGDLEAPRKVDAK